MIDPILPPPSPPSFLGATEDAPFSDPIDSTFDTGAAELPVCAFYGRVSTNQQDLRTQLHWARDTASRFDLRLPDELVFLDEDKSGRLPLVGRPSGKRLWELLTSSGWTPSAGDAPIPIRDVLVIRLDRWGRNPDDSVQNVRFLADRGVRIRFADVPMFDGSPSNLFILRIAAAVAEFEVNTIRERIRDKFVTKRARGEACGHPSYGERIVIRDEVKYVEPDETELGWVAHMQRRRAEGWGYERIATELRRQGVSTKSGKGQWQAGNVRQVLLHAEARAKRAHANS